MAIICFSYHFCLINKTVFLLVTSDLRPRLDSKRQNRNFRSICHCSGREIKEEDQDCAKRTQSRVERKVLFVSDLNSYLV